MQVQTHIIAGWCGANLFRLTARERLFCMIMSFLPDLDGIGMIFSVKFYQKYHHLLGHNILAGLVISLFFALLSTRRTVCFFVYLLLFHIHILLDYLGSGPGWGFVYLWPFSNYYIENPWVWPLQSWQTMVCLFLLLIWTFVIAYRHKRTPLEVIIPSLDRKLVKLLTKFVDGRA